MEENEWETIQPHNFATTTTVHSDEDDGDVVMVAAVPTILNEPSLFPHSNHEDLSVIPPPPENHPLQELTSPTSSSPPPSPYSSSSTDSSSGVIESELPRQPESESTRINEILGILSSGIFRMSNWISGRIGAWSIASVSAAAFVVVAVYARWWQRRLRRVEKGKRDELVLVINQKDEKIKQLLLQIYQLNRILSTRQSIPVYRVVVDRPLATIRRAN